MDNNFFEKLEKFWEEKGIDKEDRDKMLEEFINNYNKNKDVFDEDSVYDLMEMAQEADSVSEALKYINKALRIDPNNVDVLILKEQIKAKSDMDFLKKVEKILENGKKYLEDEGIYTEENIGDFWLILETRPYMRGLAFYLDMLITFAMLKKAVEVAERMLVLCENDNLGIRYRLMALYTYFEDVEKGENLYKENKKYDDTQILLPASILYYKQANFTKAKQILTRLEKSNSGTKKFFKAVAENELSSSDFEKLSGVYRPGTIEEYYMAFYDSMFLYPGVTTYFEWAYDELNKKSKK